MSSDYDEIYNGPCECDNCCEREQVRHSRRLPTAAGCFRNRHNLDLVIQRADRQETRIQELEETIRALNEKLAVIVRWTQTNPYASKK